MSEIETLYQEYVLLLERTHDKGAVTRVRHGVAKKALLRGDLTLLSHMRANLVSRIVIANYRPHPAGHLR